VASGSPIQTISEFVLAKLTEIRESSAVEQESGARALRTEVA
jgi:hypothetical protein